MAPLAVEILFQYFYLADVGNPGTKSKAHHQWQQRLISEGLLKPVEKEVGFRVAEITDKGRAHVEQICKLPLPQEKTVLIGWDGKPIEF